MLALRIGCSPDERKLFGGNDLLNGLNLTGDVVRLAFRNSPILSAISWTLTCEAVTVIVTLAVAVGPILRVSGENLFHSSCPVDEFATPKFWEMTGFFAE